MKILLFLFSFNLIDEIAPFRYVLNIASDGHKVYTSSPFGIAEFDFYRGDYIRGYILNEEVNVIAPDIYTGSIYFSSRGTLFRMNLGSGFKTSLGNFLNISSIGITQNDLYIDEKGIIKILDKFTGVEKTSGEKNIIWFGEKRNLKKDSKEIFFLSPYFYYVQNFGKVEYTVFFKEKNKIFAGTWGDGLHVYEEGIIIPQKKHSIGPATPLITFMKNTREGIWIVSRKYLNFEGLTQRRNGEWIVYKKEEVFGLPEENIKDIEEMGNKIYFSHSGGITVFEKGKFYKLTDPYFSIREINSMLINYPDMWIGTDDGIYRINPETGSILSHFLENIYVEDVEEIKGIIFAGTEKGLFYITPDKDKFLHFSDEKNYSISYILKLCKRNDTLIVGSYNGIFMIFKENEKFKVFYPSPFPSREILDMKLYKNFLFVASLDGLFYYDIKKDLWGRGNFSKGFNVSVLCLMTKDDTLWVGTDKGIFLFKL